MDNRYRLGEKGGGGGWRQNIKSLGIKVEWITIIITTFAFLPRPMRKLSGLMSLCKNPLACTYSILVICNLANETKSKVLHICSFKKM